MVGKLIKHARIIRNLDSVHLNLTARFLFHLTMAEALLQSPIQVQLIAQADGVINYAILI
jgi:hypothetical protein